MPSLFRTFCYLLLFLWAYGSQSQNEAPRLFDLKEIMEMKLEIPLKEVIKDTKERDKRNGYISYANENKQWQKIPVKVKVRGNTRSNKSICGFPPLFLHFNKDKTKQTVFKGMKKIKLVTHCRNAKYFEDFVKKEYLTYQMYEVITQYSFKTRLVRMTYTDRNEAMKESTHYAFLIEPIKKVAKRNDLKVFNGDIRNQEFLDRDNMDKLAFFEFLIGNLDWSVPERHNMKILKGDGLPIAVPYDFDFSGMVNTPYAKPPEGFEISSVDQRVFRGMCRLKGYSHMVDYFNGIKNELISLVEDAIYINDKSRQQMIGYIQSFYATINTPNERTHAIEQACWAGHQHLYQ